MAFDLGTKYIFAFFFMCFAANYLNFFGFTYLLRNLNSPEAKTLREKTHGYWYIMNTLYIVVLVLSIVFLGWLGPKCKPRKIYPPCMNFASMLFIANSIYHYMIHKKGYWLKWEGAVGSDNQQTLLAQESGVKVNKLTKDIKLVRPMFEEQMRIYVCYQVVVSVVQIII